MGIFMIKWQQMNNWGYFELLKSTALGSQHAFSIHNECAEAALCQTNSSNQCWDSCSLLQGMLVMRRSLVKLGPKMRQQTLQLLHFAMLLLDSRHVDQWVNNLDSQSCNITVASILMMNEGFCFNRTYFNRHERSLQPKQTVRDVSNIFTIDSLKFFNSSIRWVSLGFNYSSMRLLERWFN